VFVVVHRRLAEWQGRAAITTWLFAIARRVAQAHRRRASRNAAAPVEPLSDQLSDELADERPGGGDPFAELSRAQSAATVLAILEQLDDDKRVVFALVELEQLSVPEVARMLDLNLNTAYSRLRLARQAFEAAVKAQVADSMERPAPRRACPTRLARACHRTRRRSAASTAGSYRGGDRRAVGTSSARRVSPGWSPRGRGGAVVYLIARPRGGRRDAEHEPRPAERPEHTAVTKSAADDRGLNDRGWPRRRKARPSRRSGSAVVASGRCRVRRCGFPRTRPARRRRPRRARARGAIELARGRACDSRWRRCGGRRRRGAAHVGVAAAEAGSRSALQDAAGSRSRRLCQLEDPPRAQSGPRRCAVSHPVQRAFRGGVPVSRRPRRSWRAARPRVQHDAVCRRRSPRGRGAVRAAGS
jgi:RNA polymerase sigma-70 factor (ECF subfamily)